MPGLGPLREFNINAALGYLKVSCFAIVIVVIIRYVASGGDREGQGRSLIFLVKYIYIKKKNFERTDPFQSYSRILIIDIVLFWFLFIYI